MNLWFNLLGLVPSPSIFSSFLSCAWEVRLEPNVCRLKLEGNWMENENLGLSDDIFPGPFFIDSGIEFCWNFLLIVAYPVAESIAFCALSKSFTI